MHVVSWSRSSWQDDGTGAAGRQPAVIYAQSHRRLCCGCVGYLKCAMIALRVRIFLSLINDHSALMFIKVMNTLICVEESLQRRNLHLHESHRSFFRKHNQSRQGMLNCGLQSVIDYGWSLISCLFFNLTSQRPNCFDFD